MAIAIDASTPAQWTGTGTAVTSASFTPPAGAVLLIGFTSNGSAAADVSVSSITNTGTAFTATRRARKNRNASSTGGAGTDGGAEWWTGVAPGGAITITINGIGTGAGKEKSGYCYVLTGADTTALTNVAAAFSASGLPSVAVPSCLTGSYVFALSSDWAQAGLGTAGSGQTIVAETNVAGQISTHNWRTTSVLGAGGSQTMNLTAPAAEQYNLVGIEIRDAGGAAASPARMPLVINRAALIRAASF